MVVLLLWCCKPPSQPAEYDAVVQAIEIHPVPPEDGSIEAVAMYCHSAVGIEMHPVPLEDGSIEASEGPQAEEPRMLNDPASPDRAAPANVVPAGGDEAVAVHCHGAVAIEHLMIIES